MSHRVKAALYDPVRHSIEISEKRTRYCGVCLCEL